MSDKSEVKHYLNLDEEHIILKGKITLATRNMFFCKNITCNNILVLPNRMNCCRKHVCTSCAQGAICNKKCMVCKKRIDVLSNIIEFDEDLEHLIDTHEFICNKECGYSGILTKLQHHRCFITSGGNTEGKKIVISGKTGDKLVTISGGKFEDKKIDITIDKKVITSGGKISKLPTLLRDN